MDHRSSDEHDHAARDTGVHEARGASFNVKDRPTIPAFGSRRGGLSSTWNAVSSHSPSNLVPASNMSLTEWMNSYSHRSALRVRPHNPTRNSRLHDLPVAYSPSTPDLFANTSLAEPDTPHLPPRGNFARRSRPAHISTRNPTRSELHWSLQDFRAVPFQPAEHQSPRSRLGMDTAHAQQQTSRAHEQQYSTSADRQAARLAVWRARKEEIEKPFVAAFQKFQASEPVSSAAFLVHMEDAALQAKTAVRAHGIMLWFADLPRDVRKSLSNLAQFYHGEAKQMIDLTTTTRRGGSWADVTEFDRETLHAANMTKIEKIGKSFKVTRFHPFGSDKREPAPIQCPGFLRRDLFKESDKLHEDTVWALATCKVALVYLSSDACLSHPNLLIFGQSLEHFVNTCAGMTFTMQNSLHLVNKSGVALDEMKLFGCVLKEIKRMGEVAKYDARLAKIATGRALAWDYEQTYEALARARMAAAPGIDTQQVEELEERCQEFVIKLLEIEGGDDDVGHMFGGRWKRLQMAD